MTDTPPSQVPGYEAGKDAAELFGWMTRLLIYGNGGGVTACVLMAAAMTQAGSYTAWTVVPLALFWLGLFFAFWVLAGLHAGAVARVAEENVLLDPMMKRRRRMPGLGWDFALEDYSHMAGGAAGPSLVVSGIFFVIGSFLGVVLLSFL